MTGSARSAAPARAFGIVRFAWGSFLVAAPGRVISAMGGTDERASRNVARALGARHVLQALAEIGAGSERRRLGTVVDALHAASAVVMAALDSRWRRPAATDAVIATSFAVVNEKLAGRD